MTDYPSGRTSFTSFLVGVGIFTAILMTTGAGYQFFSKKRITCFYSDGLGSVTFSKRFNPNCEKLLGPNWHSKSTAQ